MTDEIKAASPYLNREPRSYHDALKAKLAEHDYPIGKVLSSAVVNSCSDPLTSPRHPEYCQALKDISLLISKAALDWRMDVRTLDAMNNAIAKLSRGEQP